MRVCGGLRGSTEEAVLDCVACCKVPGSVDSVGCASSPRMVCCDDDRPVDGVATVAGAGSKGRELCMIVKSGSGPRLALSAATMATSLARFRAFSVRFRLSVTSGVSGSKGPLFGGGPLLPAAEAVSASKYWKFPPAPADSATPFASRRERPWTPPGRWLIAAASLWACCRAFLSAKIRHHVSCSLSDGIVA